MNVLRCVVIALFLCTFAVAAQGADRFVSAAAGFSMDKPAGWAVARRPNGEVSAEELQTAIERKQMVLLVAMTNDLLPLSRFQVTLIPNNESFGEASPRQIVESRILPLLQKKSPSFALSSPVRELELSGHAAAEYAATDAIRAEGLSMPVRMQAVLVARGRFFFLIDMFSPAGEQSGEEFAKLVSGITLEKQPR